MPDPKGPFRPPNSPAARYRTVADRPWTHGPWQWEAPPAYSADAALHGEDSLVLRFGREDEGPNDADAALIALAPEMAEAILHCDTLPVMPKVLKPVIEKLRQIGAG